MGIMQFESWQARGFGVPVLGRSGAAGGRGSLSTAQELCLENLSQVPEAKTGPFSWSIIWLESIQSLLCTYCVQSAVLGAKEHSAVIKGSSLLSGTSYPVEEQENP